MPFCVQSKGKHLLFIDRVLYSVTGGRAFMEDGACRTSKDGRGLLEDGSSARGQRHGRQDFAGGCSEVYISLCKNDGVVCVCAV